jgi:hypothetical protein
LLIATATQGFNIPYRPSADNAHCTNPGTDSNGGNDIGKWYSAADNTCYNGYATPITFSPLTGVTLPDQVIVALAYNTSDYGNPPYGTGTACHATPAGCGYDSLNVGLWSPPTIGIDPQPSDAYLNSSYGGAYCDGGLGGTGSFRLDAGCWEGFQPAIRIQVDDTSHDVDAHLKIGGDIGLGGSGTKTTDVKTDCKNEEPAEQVHCTLQVSGLPAGCTATSSSGPSASAPGGFLLNRIDSYALNQTRHFDFKLTMTCSPNLAQGAVAMLQFKMCADGGFIDPDPCVDSDLTPDKSPNVVVKAVKLHR